MPEVTTPFKLELPPLYTEIAGNWVVFYDEVASTQQEALKSRMDGAVFVADAQTQGRGRLGRSWLSQRGKGLWFSVALQGPAKGLNFAGALAVRNAARPSAYLELKWPNDLL